MTFTRLAPTALLALAACAVAPYDRPWSSIEYDPSPSADPLVIPVIVNRVDGVTSVHPDRAMVAPGRHVVTLDVPPRRGFHVGTQVDFEMDVAPCTRYYVAARLASTVTQDWKPVVRSTQPIGECVQRFAGTTPR